MIFLMMAAHDTSTITATAMAFYFAKHPEWQARAREESLALGTSQPTIEQLDSLTTLDLVFKEAMRLVAPVPALVRRTTADTALLGRFIPKGTIVNRRSWRAPSPRRPLGRCRRVRPAPARQPP